MELNKSDKRIAREIIEKGLMEEFKQGLLSFDNILQQWKNETGDNREYYHKVYVAVKDFNKQIAGKYDDMRPSRYIDTIVLQLRNKLIDISEIEA